MWMVFQANFIFLYYIFLSFCSGLCDCSHTCKETCFFCSEIGPEHGSMSGFGLVQFVIEFNDTNGPLWAHARRSYKTPSTPSYKMQNIRTQRWASLKHNLHLHRLYQDSDMTLVTEDSEWEFHRWPQKCPYLVSYSWSEIYLNALWGNQPTRNNSTVSDMELSLMNICPKN